MTYPTYHNLIGGEWVPAASGKTLLNLNPADHADVVGAFPSSHAEDVANAVGAAKKAFASWRLVPAPKRAEILVRAGSILQERKEQYARDMTREMGKVLAETRGDVQEAIDEAFYVAGEGRRLFGVTTPSELQNKFAMSVRMPVGVVGMITPWKHRSRPTTWSRLSSMLGCLPALLILLPVWDPTRVRRSLNI
jgi:aldehyde dehydrogenase (NAD+)